MNVLITGSNGQLGHALRAMAEGYGHNFIFTDIAAGDGIASLDVTDGDAVRKFVKDNEIGVVVNCAGYTDVNKAEDEEDKALRINAAAPAILASAAKEADAVLIHISTDYVFDGKANTPYPEDAEPNPLNAYARTKLEGDKAVMASGCRYIILRSAWIYSCYGRNFFLTMADKTSAMPSISVVDDQTGTPTYAPDLAFAILHIIDEGKLGHTGIYNFSNEGVCSWYDFAKAINRGLGYLCDVRPCRSSEFPSKAVRPSYSVLDKTLFKKTFGLEVPHWQDSLDLCIKEFINNH